MKIPPDEKNPTQGQFYAGFNRFEFRVFLLPKLLSIPGLNSFVCPAIYP